MNIVHVVDHLKIGGLEKVVVDLALEQKKQGDNVFCYCLHTKGDLASHLIDAGVEVYAYQKNKSFDVKAFFDLRKFINQRNIQVVHTHNQYVNFYGAIGGWLSSAKRVINTRHGLGNYPLRSRTDKVFKFSAYFTEKVACVCEKVKSNLDRSKIVNPQKTVVAYNGIDLSAYESISEEQKQKLREEFNINPQHQIIGTVCRLSEVKNIPLLIKSAKDVLTQFNDVTFVVVGDGPEKEKLEQFAEEIKISDRIIFIGARHDVPVWMSLFDIFVLPSFSEGMSLTLIEAMAGETAVVASDVGGNSEVVLDRKTGFIFPSEDQPKLTESLLNLLQNQELSREFAKAGRDRAFLFFGIQKMAENYKRLYDLKETV